MPFPLNFDTESLPDFHVGVAANFQIQVSGGTPPYTFSITQGTLPKLLAMSTKGKITGIPRRTADTTVFVKVVDKLRGHLTQAFAVRVEP